MRQFSIACSNRRHFTNTDNLLPEHVEEMQLFFLFLINQYNMYSDAVRSRIYRESCSFRNKILDSKHEGNFITQSACFGVLSNLGLRAVFILSRHRVSSTLFKGVTTTIRGCKRCRDNTGISVKAARFRDFGVRVTIVF